MDEMTCRSCMSTVSETNSHPILEIGWTSLTLKQMFETSLNYEIVDSEPQRFCYGCTQALVEWHQFKSICQSTQEALVSVKIEPELIIDWNEQDESEKFETGIDELQSVEIEAEFKNEIEETQTVNVEPELKFETDIEETQSLRIQRVYKYENKMDFSGPFELQFDMFLRNYNNLNMRYCTPLGTLDIQGTTLEEINDKIWVAIEPYLKREIVFDEYDPIPMWHYHDNPQKRDLDRFVLFQNSKTYVKWNNLSLLRIKLWHGEKHILFVYPYSKNVLTKQQMKAAKAVLIEPNSNEAKTFLGEMKAKHIDIFSEFLAHRHVFKNLSLEFLSEPIDVYIPVNTTNFPVVYKFEAYLRNCRTARKQYFIGNFTIAGNDLSDIIHNLWLAVEPHVVREIVVTKTNKTMWHPKGFPEKGDLSKFVEFNRPGKSEVMTLSRITTSYFLSNDREFIVIIYPFSSAMSSVKIWGQAKKLIDDIRKELSKYTKLQEEDRSHNLFICPYEGCDRSFGIKYKTQYKSHQRICRFNPNREENIDNRGSNSVKRKINEDTVDQNELNEACCKRS